MEKLTKKENIIVVVCILIIGISFLALYAIYREDTKEAPFIYRDVVQEVAFCVGEEELYFSDVSYYIMVLETNLSPLAYSFNDNSFFDFWKMRLNKEYQNLETLAKEEIKKACIRDNIYYQQALSEGYELSEEELLQVKEDAIDEMNKLTDYQIAQTDYTLENMQETLTKIQYAKNYVADLMEEGYTQEQLDVDGEKYQEIKEQFQIEIKEDIWEKVEIGQVVLKDSKVTEDDL